MAMTMISPFEIDLPGELEVDNIIRFPGDWEPDPEPPSACALCGEDGADAESGVCWICAQRLPRIGQCALTVQIVASLAAGNGGMAVDHLVNCKPCRGLFERLGDLARVASLEMDTLYAEPLKVAA